MDEANNQSASSARHVIVTTSEHERFATRLSELEARISHISARPEQRTVALDSADAAATSSTIVNNDRSNRALRERRHRRHQSGLSSSLCSPSLTRVSARSTPPFVEELRSVGQRSLPVCPIPSSEKHHVSGQLSPVGLRVVFDRVQVTRSQAPYVAVVKELRLTEDVASSGIVNSGSGCILRRSRKPHYRYRSGESSKSLSCASVKLSRPHPRCVVEPWVANLRPIGYRDASKTTAFFLGMRDAASSSKVSLLWRDAKFLKRGGSRTDAEVSKLTEVHRSIGD